MGKAQIINHIADGEYRVSILHDQDDYDAKINLLNARINALQDLEDGAQDVIDTLIANGYEEDDPLVLKFKKEKALYKLKKTACEKRKEYLQNNNPQTPQYENIWCADLTKDLTGEVATAEVPDGFLEHRQIRPGFGGNANHLNWRDGELQYPVVSTPSGVYFNRALYPAWQKWKPGYRYGRIIQINPDGTTVNVRLNGAYSKEQNLYIDQERVLSNVPVQYMDCHQEAFEVNDEVLIRFYNQNQKTPYIVGFRDNPRPCVWEHWISNRHNWFPYIDGSDGIINAFPWDGRTVYSGSSYIQLYKFNGTTRLKFYTMGGYYNSFMECTVPPVMNEAKMKLKIIRAYARGDENCDIGIRLNYPMGQKDIKVFIVKTWKGTLEGNTITALLPGDPSDIFNSEYEIDLNQYGVDFGSTVPQIRIELYTGSGPCFLDMEYLDIK